MAKKRDLNAIMQRILAFNKARDWEQFHNFKDLSLSLAVEAAELMEHFQWRAADELKAYAKKHKKEIGEEIADVLYWTLLTAWYLGLDPLEALERKMTKNEKKYPVKKMKGRHSNHYGSGA